MIIADFIIKNCDGSFIATQIKTRDLSNPPFSANDPQVTGAIGKFCRLDRRFPGHFAGFDFTTNHGFSEREQAPTNLPWILEVLRLRGGIKGLRKDHIARAFVESLANDTGLASSDVASTLIRTTLRGHKSPISHINASVQDALCECPGIMELPYSTVAAISKAVIQLARDASAKNLRGSITELFELGTDLAEALDGQLLAGKRISRGDVVAIIDQHTSEEKKYQDVDVSELITPADAPSDLVIAFRKLAKGGVQAARVTNVQDRVRSLEALFLQWTRRFGVDEARRRYSNVLAAVQHEAAEAQAAAEKSALPYGSEMYSILAERLMARARDDRDQLYGCRPEHLIGAAGVLTQQCKAWWSPPFDVGSAP